ncbi:outer membrane beta-barrel protein [Bosea sp. R86505]|uniref:outer membrane beta-barrel protein n=1 Tax=Bosea sp. R86505 TaxID=3101710 RepID=UPI00366AEDA4
MSTRVTLLLTGVAAASLVLATTIVSAQQTRRTPLRPTVPAYVAQQPPRDPGAVPATPDVLGDPAGLIRAQPSAISNRAPPYASRSVRGSGVRGVTQRQFRAPPPTVTGLPAVPPAPPPPRRAPAAQEDPYAPLGLRLGSVVLRPALTNSVGYDTNPQRTAGSTRKGSPFSRHEGEVDIQSNWNVHELTGRLRAGYSEFYRDREASRPDGEGNLQLRLDASRDTRILLETRARLDTQRPGSPDLTAAVVGRPLVYQYGASAGVTHDVNRLQMTLRGSVDRSDYEDGKLSNGGIVSQRDRNQTQYGLRLRAAYEVTPGFRPFVQGEVDTRDFDQAIDSSGYRRSSNGITARVGSTFEISRQLTGEVSVGYQDRKYDDARLRNLRGLIGDAAILWSPTPLTTVTLRGTSELGDTTVAGSSGTTARRVSLEVAHALRRNLTVTAFGSFNRTEYEGQGLREDSSSIGARLDYKLTRTFSVRASFTHERLNSSAQGSDYTANVAQVGLRLQF